MEKVNLSQISKNIFKEGIYAEIDDIQKELLLLENLFENVCFSLNEGNPNNTEIKLELNKDKIASLTITKNRFENLLKDKKRSDRIDELLRNKRNIICSRYKRVIPSLNPLISSLSSYSAKFNSYIKIFQMVPLVLLLEI